jgi:flagellar hook-associated protein 2
MTTTTSTANTSQTASIVKTLGGGSGIDINALVNSLVDAQYAVKNDSLTQKSDALTAQISSVGTLKSSITGFDTALKSLITTGTLVTQPTSSNTGILKTTVLSGANVAGIASTVEVRQMAQAQVSSTAPLDKTAAIGTGKLTLTFGSATVTDGAMTDFTAGSATAIDIPIDSAHSTLSGIVSAINAKNAGVTASILSDSGGARLVLKSSTGASQAFTLAATEDVGAEGLAALNVGVGATGTSIGSTAQDAIVAVDGVAVHRASNTILDAVPGVRLDLVTASVGTKVSIGSTPPTEALTQAVNDVVATYNELLATLKTATDNTTGPLKSDAAAKSLLRSLQDLTTSQLVTGAATGAPTTLAGLGVATNRDGTLQVNSGQLATALSSFGGTVEAMFKSGTGLSAALSKIATAATSTTYGLGASEQNYTNAKNDVAEDIDKASAAADNMRTRMTQQFAGMDSAVAAYKSTQSFLTNQVAAWNSSNN